MGLFGTYMPGESSGIPTQGLSGLLGGGKMDLGLLGLSLLANNNSKNFGQNLGRAGLATIQNQQRFKQMQLLQELRKQQAEQATQRTNIMQKNSDMAEAKWKADQELIKQRKSALEQLQKSNPNIDQTLLAIDPDLAIKRAYPDITKPQASQAGFFTYGPNGVTLLKDPITGAPLLPPAYDNGLSYSNALSKGLGKADTTITDKEDGVLQTEGNLLRKTGNLPKQSMQPVQSNVQQRQPQVTPNIVPSNVQKQRDMTATQILMDEFNNETNPRNKELIAKELKENHNVDVGYGSQLAGGGIRVPTKAEEAAEVEAAKLKAKELADAQIDLPRVVDEGQAAIQLVDELLNHEGFEGAVGLSSYNPLNKMAGSPENDFNIRLDQIKGKQFLQAFQSLKGGGQITEVEGKKATDAIARMQTSASEEEFIKAAEDFKQVIRAGINRANKRAGGQGQIMPSNEPMPAKRSREDILKQYGAI